MLLLLIGQCAQVVAGTLRPSASNLSLSIMTISRPAISGPAVVTLR